MGFIYKILITLYICLNHYRLFSLAADLQLLGTLAPHCQMEQPPSTSGESGTTVGMVVSRVLALFPTDVISCKAPSCAIIHFRQNRLSSAHFPHGASDLKAHNWLHPGSEPSQRKGVPISLWKTVRAAKTMLHPMWKRTQSQFVQHGYRPL